MMAKERKQKERKLLENVKNSPHDGGFARALGSTDFHTRERGLEALTLWLTGHKQVTETDLLRLWKALFYCFWHSDRVPVQACYSCIHSQSSKFSSETCSNKTSMVNKNFRICRPRLPNVLVKS